MELRKQRTGGNGATGMRVCNQGWTRLETAARAHDACVAALHAWMAALHAGGSVRMVARALDGELSWAFTGELKDVMEVSWKF